MPRRAISRAGGEQQTVVALSISTALKSRRTIGAAACAAIIAVAGLIYWVRSASDAASAVRGPVRPVVSVTVANVTRQDVPIYLVGLGTVQSSFTVGIHSQIDGKLLEVRFTEGQHVKKGDVLAKIDPRLFQAALDQSKAKRAQDQAMLVSYEKDLARYRELSTKGFETQQNIDQQYAKVENAKAAIAADEAAMETAQTQLDYTDIVAPSDGRMGVRLVDPGNVVRASDQGSIALLVQAQPCFVLFTLPAHTLQDVREAKAGETLEVMAFDRDFRRKLSIGTLQTIDNVIDPATATYKLKAIFRNEDERLWPGDFVNARLLIETRKDALVIPSTAVQRGPNGLFAWIVTANNTAEPRAITIGPVSGDLTIVASGLNSDERVVTGGQYKLQNNSPVAVQTPTAPKPQRNS